MGKGIKRKIIKARNRVTKEISGYAGRGSIAQALSSEGYAGGYRDCLDDIILLLNGNNPKRRDYWDDLNQ